MEQYTREQLDAMETVELVKLYNKLSTKKVKRFESRKTAVEKLLKLLADRAAIAAALPQGTVRTVSKMKSAKAGRPVVDFAVTACAEGKSEVRESSLRGQIMAFIKALPNATATIVQLEAKFGDKARSAVQKLMAVDWLKKAEPEAA